MLQCHIKIRENVLYGKCSKISNSSCLLKRHRQTVQTQIRLLLKKQTIWVFPVCLFSQTFFRSSLIWVFPVCLFSQAFCEFQPENQHVLENRKRVRNFRTFKVSMFSTKICFGFSEETTLLITQSIYYDE